MDITREDIIRLKTGDTEVFDEIYNKMFYSLCVFGLKIIPEVDVVNDVVQESFIAFWSKKEQFDDLIKIKAYLYTSVRNKILTEIRNKHTESIESQLLVGVETNNYITLEETYCLLYDSINALSGQTSKIMRLALKGYGNNEIAISLNISINTVKTLKKNAYAKLREKLRDNFFALVLLSDLLY
ncbi:MAG: sigma-70 family RNA polymerase sigma factor [Carboxylicivirga sp.]|jgi:RNA polymerase sigma-70 factor (ECF subfamily)|nr:sigma-70 family RNA polymerase sigma factor [Carboxylicivirga sp.]